jgi:DNA-binding response OmpR family regulator
MATILIIDTPEGDASVLASALRVEGFEVVVVPSASAARKVLAEGTVALTVVDLMLRTEGEKHGLELARELRTGHPGMRVLLTSAYHLSERQLERADCGVSGFIPKPYEVDEVVAFIVAKVSGPPSSRRVWHAEPPSSVMGAPKSQAAPRTLTSAVDIDDNSPLGSPSLVDAVAVRRR